MFQVKKLYEARGVHVENFTWESLSTLKMHVVMMNCINCTYVSCYFSLESFYDKGFTPGKNFFPSFFHKVHLKYKCKVFWKGSH